MREGHLMQAKTFIETFRVEDYRNLAFSHINRLPKFMKRDVEEDDLFNAALLGIFLASKNFDERKGTKFTTFCYWYIQQEIIKTTSRVVEVDGNRKFQRRVKEDLYEDADQEQASYDDAIPLDDCKISNIFIDKYLEDLPLEGLERQFFIDMYEADETTAANNYRAMTGFTRQAASLMKIKVREIARRRYEKLERD